MKPNETFVPIEFGAEAINVDARLIGDGFDLDPSTVLKRMREGDITSLCEAGTDEDAGRYRLTFFHGSQRCRLIVNQDGRILRRSVLDFGDRPLPAAARRSPAAPSAPAATPPATRRPSRPAG